MAWTVSILDTWHSKYWHNCLVYSRNDSVRSEVRFSVLWRSANVRLMSVRVRYIIISYWLLTLTLTTTTTTTAATAARELHHYLYSETVPDWLCKNMVKAQHKALSDWRTFIREDSRGELRSTTRWRSGPGGGWVSGSHLHPSLLDNVFIRQQLTF